MALRGFWQAALAEPDRRALIESDGRTLSAGELAGASHQLVHALRARGLARGDVVAMLLPNAAPALEVLLAAMQAGWYITPINTNLAPPEIAHILRDSGARAFVADAREAERALRAADEAELPAAARIAVGELPGFASYAALKREQPARSRRERCAGQFMQYTSGTTGKPKGIKRDLIAMDPDVMGGLQAGHLGRFGITPGGAGVHLCTSPMYHTAPLAFSWFSLHFEHTVVLMDRWDPERALQLIEKHRVTTTHMVPTQFHRLLHAPGSRAAPLRLLLAAERAARRGALPRRGEAPHARVVGPGDLRVLRRDGGRRHARHAAGMARAPGDGRPALGRRRRSACSTTRARTARRGNPGRCI